MITDLFASILSVGIPVIAIALKRVKGSENKELLFKLKSNPLRSMGIKKVIIYIIVSVALFFCSYYLYNALSLLYISMTSDYSIVTVPVKAGCLLIIIAVFIYAILPSLFEEILYRGMYSVAFSGNSILLQYLIPSLVFASCHSNALSIINAFALGVILMVCYKRTGSLKAVMIMHFINNFFGIMFSNVVTLPFSTLAVLNDYANKEQLISASVFSFGIFLLSAILIVIGLIYANAARKTCDDHESSDCTALSKQKRVLDRLYIILVAAISTTVCVLKAT